MKRIMLLASPLFASAFYLPGVSPREYAQNEQVEMKVNKLTSTKTQLPYEYYSLPSVSPSTWSTRRRTWEKFERR